MKEPQRYNNNTSSGHRRDRKYPWYVEERRELQWRWALKKFQGKG